MCVFSIEEKKKRKKKKQEHLHYLCLGGGSMRGH